MSNPRSTQAPTTKATIAPGQDPSVRQGMEALINEVGKVIVGKRSILEVVAAAMLTEGAHILFEDLPGLAKSVMASTFARASGTTFKRVQFTPDLLPSDITGTFILDREHGRFEFRPGPLFTNILLADEINRASPKTQSALLEAMAEKQVSVEGTTHKLPKPFLVMATQNPIEQEGTYPLPEAQLDRFMIKTSVGYPSVQDESEILHRRNTRMKDEFDVAPVMTSDHILALQKKVERVRIERSLIDYVAQVVVSTREHEHVLAGASPRGSLALLKLSKSRAALNGRNFVVPEDIRGLVLPVLGHRLILRPEPRVRGVTTSDVLTDVLRKIPVPKL